jgi:peptidase M28-like protein
VENRSVSFLAFLFILAVAAVGILHEGTPDPLPASASPDLFSADRALVYLNVFATSPHPLGSQQHDRVREYLVPQLTSLGVAPEIQRTVGVTPRYQVAGSIENIVARLKGSSGAPDAVALGAHYDSVAAGPGAGDDGAGVAALLETLRALRSGPPLRNDMIFLFTDGEEEGLLGASAFVDEHPWAKDVRVFVNFEARGNAGASQMFETSAGNGRLIQIFAQAAPHPSANSLTYEIYKHMPNDTDLTVFKKSGAGGLNFGFIGNWGAYHTPLDNPQQLDRASLQHHGENALSLARALGNTNLSLLQDRDAVYFSLPGNLFVHYSGRLIWPIVITTGVVLLAVVFYANGAWQTSLGGIFGGIFAHLGLAILLFGVGFGFSYGVRWLHHNILPEGPVEQNPSYVLGLFALLIALQSLFYKLLRKKISASALFLGGGLLIFALVYITAKFLPGGSYLFVWPLLAGLLAMVTVAFRPGHLSFLGVFVLCLLSLPALLLFIPLLKGLYTALGFNSMGAPPMSLLLALFLILLSPLWESVLAGSRNLVPGASLLAAVCLSVTGAWTTRYDSVHPKPSMLAYALDAGTGKALWTSSAARLDPWTEHYVSASPQRAKLPDFYPDWLPLEFLQHEAPALPLLPPRAELLENSVADGIRTLHLRITSPRHAPNIHVGIAQSEVLSASVNGHDFGNPSEARWHQPGHWSFDYANPSDKGIDLQLHVQGTAPVSLVLIDRSSGLPSLPGTDLPPRPPDSMPFHSGDQTMVRRSFVF